MYVCLHVLYHSLFPPHVSLPRYFICFLSPFLLHFLSLSLCVFFCICVFFISGALGVTWVKYYCKYLKDNKLFDMVPVEQKTTTKQVA